MNYQLTPDHRKLMAGELKEKRQALLTKNLLKGFSLIVGLSQYRYYGVMVTDKTFN